MRPGPGVDPRFLAYVARSLPFAQYAMATVEGVRMPRTSWSSLSTYRVHVPPPGRQSAIADFLDGQCRRLQELDAALGSLVAAAREALNVRRRELIGIGSEQTVQIRYVARTGTGHTPSRSRRELWRPDDCVIPWFTLADVHRIRDEATDVVSETAEHVSALGVANSAAVVHPAGTVILSRTASVGFAAIMGTDMAVSQDFMTWTCGPRLRPRFLLHALRAARPELLGLMHGSTHKTIYMPDLLALRVPLPSVERQDSAVGAIEHRVDAFRAATGVVAAARTRLAEYRDALVTEAVTGQLDVAKLSDVQTEERLHAVAEGAPATGTPATAAL